jgi:murein DD-endopeptidase MepM/ murein hydrolase activator NlpD
MADLDIVGSAAVDVVPLVTNFHSRLKAAVLPAADRVGREAGERMGNEISRNIVISIPSAVTQGGTAAQRAATRQGSDVGGAFAGSLRRRLEAAFKAMPKLDIRLSDTGVDAELARLRARMETLSNKRIGVDVDVAAAAAEVKRIEAELKRLGANHPNVAVRADTATARAALAELQAEIAAVDAREPRIRVHADTAQATGALLALSIQAAILTAIPLGPALAAGLGGVAAMATAAGAGLGGLALVAIPAIKGVTEALQAKKAAEKESAQATDTSAKSNTQAAQHALQLAGAQSTLASAHRQAAQSIAQANRQVETAERGVAQAVQRAADQRRQAADSVERAERSLSDAQRTARQAELDLTQARADAVAQLKALNDKLTDGALDQRAATLRVQQAQEDLNAVLADPMATDLQREAAQLTYDQAVQAAKEQKQSYADLQKEAAKQRKAGVAGNDAVKAATQRVVDAQRDVIDNVKALADVQQASARAQVDAAQTVVDAQRALSDAVQNAANTQVSAAESIASAERGVESARLSGVDATTKAVTKSDEYRKMLAKMTPEQRALFDSIAGPRGLTSAFKEWSRSLHPEVLPLFTRGVDSAKASLPGFTPLVLGAAAGVKTLYDKASAQMKTPFWQGFKADLKESVQPAVVGFGVAFGNVIKGVAGIIDAFLPHMDGIAKKSDDITARFARWGTSLKGSPDFEKFLKYVKDTSPGLAEFLGDILTAALDVAQALSPLSSAMFAVVGPLFQAISWLSTNAPGFVQVLWGLFFAQKAIAVGMAAFAVAMGLYEIVIAAATLVTSGWAVALQATGIVPLIEAIILIIVLLVAAVIYAYTHWDWFRAIVDGAIHAIAAVALWLWNVILKPTFDAIWWAIKKIADIAVWLWQNVIGPAFSFIGEAAKLLFTALVTLFLLPAYLAFQALGAIGKWLWEKVISPTFGWIGDKATWLWEKAIKPTFQWIGDKATWLYNKAIKPAMAESKKALQLLGEMAKWLWEKAISPVFGWIADKADWLYQKGVKPPMDKVRALMGPVVAAFKTARDGIKKHWDQVADIAKKPVAFVISHVYNEGIVPLWNHVASITGVGKLKPMDLKGFHEGGIMSGYSPGRDDRVIAVGGGEAVMRPEWTRAIGADRINSWNAAARSGGVGGVQRAIAGGMSAFQDGGIVGWFKDRGNDVGNFISGAADYANPSKVFDKATGFIKNQLEPLMTNPWSKSVAKIPGEMLSALKDKALNVFGFGGGGSGGGNGQWAKPVNVPYGTKFGVAGSMWSSGHHTGLDFPAAVGTAIKAVADGRVSQATSGGPYGIHAMINHGGGLSSLYAHMSQLLTSVGKSVHQGDVIGRVGATGNVTGPHLHLEARVNGRAVDPMAYLAGGGAGYGAQASGAAQNYAKGQLSRHGWGASQFGPLKTLWNGESGWNYRARNPSSGAYGIPQALPASKMASAGSDWLTNYATQIRWGLGYIDSRYGSPASALSQWQARSPHWYDEGGYLPEGLSLVANGTGRPEPVFTGSQWDTLRASAGRSSGPAELHADVRVFVGDREITEIVDTQIELHESGTAAAINTGRWNS